MKNLPFIVWMLGWFLIDSVARYLHDISPHYKEYSTEVKGLAAISFLFIWIGVGYLVYEKKKVEKNNE